ncbi:Serine/threonine-protein kinase Nek8 [Camellia lanceoleosa]|uniref:Serine/threonine-protein kinase Nek8 n=1 Tax=Camellia lanceoleosa TaxID=1840588 RepID=A0ACC0H399_9ERIC|nr:Serine/threonine-protein kinase Nek8 [Camellia lanceoleosa]
MKHKYSKNSVVTRLHLLSVSRYQDGQDDTRSQLGREGHENLPLVVEELVGETPVSVSGGRVHSVALTSKREVWVWGGGRNGGLGLGSSIGEDEPKLVEYLEGSEVLQAVSGFDHNLVLVSE